MEAVVWSMIGAVLGTVFTLAALFGARALVHRLIPIPDGPTRLPPSIPRVEEIDVNPPTPEPEGETEQVPVVMLREVPKAEADRLREKHANDKALPENVKEAFVEYVKARLEANGNQRLKVKDLLVEFAKWHGPKNLDRGILRPNPPPIPELALAPKIKEEC